MKKNLKSLYKISIMVLLMLFIIMLSKTYAADLAISVNGNNVTISSEYTGKVNLSITGGTLSSNSVWVENNSQKVSVNVTSENGATITATPETMSNSDGILVQVGSKSITIPGIKKPVEQPTQPTTPTTPTQPTAPTFSNTNKKMYATDKINLRSSWSTSSAATSVEKGTELTVTGTSTEKINGYVWYRVSYNGTKYVASGLLTATKPQVEENKEDENKEKSSNKALKDLVVQNYKLSPEFTSENTKYTLEVTKEVDKLEITPIPEDSEAKVQIAGNENFKIGNNIVKITVTAEDGTTRIYTITVTKTNQSGNEEEGNTLKLKSLQIKEGTLSPSFDPETTNYTVEVSDPASININEFITAIAEDEDVELIAIASSGKGRVTKFFIGSVAEKVIHSFKKDVLLVH